METKKFPVLSIFKKCQYVSALRRYIRKLATKPNTSYNCSSTQEDSGFTTGSVISYGNLGTTGELKVGDAFDCDVNGDAIYNQETERFYYITNLDANPNHAVLLYYSNTTKGIPNNVLESGMYYNEKQNSWRYGPELVMLDLPTNEQWPNVKLTTTTKPIYNQHGGIVLNEYSYKGYAARLISLMDIKKEISIQPYRQGLFNNAEYNFFLENTSYTNSNKILGYWLEDTHDTASNYAMEIGGYYTSFGHSLIDVANYGSRPAIEVDKNDIEY